MNTLRIIFDGGLNEDDLTRFFEARKLKVLRQTQPTQEMPYEIIFGSEQAEARYIEDQFICVKYIDLIGPNYRALAAELRTNLPYISDQEILTNAAAEGMTVQDQVDWLMLATALGEVTHRPEVEALIIGAMRSSEAPLRHASLIAAGWLQWPCFLTEIEHLTKDKVPEVQHHARMIKQGFELAQKPN
jgi:hypothetical protein